MSSITLGSDPEVFLKRGDKFISSIGLVGGTKAKPKKFGRGYNMHEDNVSVEFNVPPVTSEARWLEVHAYALERVGQLAKKHDCEVAIVSDAEFEPDQLDNDEARSFGCNPDFDAWNICPNPSPNGATTNLRTAGGHIHIGTDLKLVEKVELIRVLDIFLGIPLNMLEPESKRQKLYGKLGACRIKPYGVEYRVPSNFWLRTPELQAGVFNVVMQLTKERSYYWQILRKMENLIETVANNGSVPSEYFSELMKNIPYPSEAVYAQAASRMGQ